MKTPTLIKLSLIFVVLIAAILAQHFFLPKLFTPKSPYLDVVGKITPDQASLVILEKSSQKLELIKTDGNWKTADYPVKTWQVDTLVRTLLTPDQPQLVANTSARHTDLGVDLDHATKISIKSPGRDLLPLLASSTGNQFYIRFDGESPVFSLGSTPPQISTDPTDWYDLTITQLDASQISQITIQGGQTLKSSQGLTPKPGETFTLNKEDNQWTLKDSDKSLNQDKVTTLTSSLALLSATKLDTSITPDKLTNPQASLSLSIKDQTDPIVLQLTPENPKDKTTSPDYYITKPGDSRVFVIPNSTAEILLKPLSNYFAS